MITGFLLVLSLGTTAPPAPTCCNAAEMQLSEIPEYYEEIKDIAMNFCPYKKYKKINENIVDDLIKIEDHFFKSYQIPEDLRGMILAAACNESGYNPLAKGDWRKTKRGKRVARAHGILQLWPWWIKKYKVNRFNHIQSAKAWMSHIVRQRHKIEKKRQCGKRMSNLKKWVVAWVQVTRGRLTKENNYRCGQAPSHYKRLKRWYRTLASLAEDGC
jgi:hypothetical protein